MPDKAVDGIRKAVDKTRYETNKLIKETRRTRYELTPRPIREWLLGRFKRRWEI